MKKYIILLAAAAMVLGACTKREFVDNAALVDANLATLTCSLPVDGTKATLDGQGKVAWSENDSIVVWNYIDGTKGESSAKIYKLVSGAGTATGVFQGEAFDKGVARVAMYPVLYSSGVMFQSGASKRVYYHVPTTINMDSADAKQESSVLLFGYINDPAKPFFFEHGGSVLRLQFRNIPVAARKIKLYQPDVTTDSLKQYALIGTRYFSSENLKGKTGNPLGNTLSTSSSIAHANMSLTFPGGKEGSGLVSGKGVFDFPIPVCSAIRHRHFTVNFLDANDQVIEGTTREFRTDSLKTGRMVVKPEISAWASDTTKAKVIMTADEFIAWLTANNEDGELGADIDLAGKTLPTIACLTSSLYGKGYTISGANISASPIIKLSATFKDVKFSGCAFSRPLFARTSESATVCGLSFDSTCSIEWPTPTATDTLGVIAGTNAGTIKDCSTSISHVQTFPTLPDGPVLMGGIVGYSTGLVSGCSNYGQENVYVKAPTSGKRHYLGGIVGKIKGTAGKPILKDCTNKAAVSIKYDTKVYYIIGGVAGATELIAVKETEAGNYGNIEGCRNYGAISMYYTSGGSGAYPEAGGIIGYAEAFISDCENWGEISLKCESTTATWTGMKVGGIAGICSAGMNGCKNHGTIKIDAVIAGGTAGAISAGNTARCCWAGVCGSAGPFVKASDNVIFENCSNDASFELHPVSITGSPVSNMGGVFGCATGKVIGCTNTGNIIFSCPESTNLVGGVIASTTASFSLCTNEGNISVDAMNCAKKDWKTYAGGICGQMSGADATSASSCTNSGDINFQATGATRSTENTYLAGIIGNKANGAITVSSDCKNSGTVSNFSGFDNVYSDDIYCPVPEVPVDPETLYAEGYVRDNGGSAYAGMVVSDGFNTTTTNAQGYYKLTTSMDTRYIYYSIPANVKIGKNADGCPDYYLKYEFGRSTGYDFTVELQTPENEFSIFVLGDPQAHYAIKGSQKYSGTDRFLTESVSAMNSEISKQTVPCYGVTMGDIVYSDGSVNSNPGMPTMRSHISKLNMPVFQVFGNHDITYHSNGSTISTDLHSSTINLVSQRAFESYFGPIDHSFTRGNVHIVCMKNIHTNCTTTWNSSNYVCGYTDSQLQWLKDDLSHVSKDHMLIFCSHVPIATKSYSQKNVQQVIDLIKGYTNVHIFSGHTHTKIGGKVSGENIYEHTHNALCGTFWYSNTCADGTPQGYTVYKIKDKEFTDEYFMGVNKDVNTRDNQMRIYRANMKTGGPKAYFNWMMGQNVLFINLFNGDSRWKSIKVYENGVDCGSPTLIPNKAYEFTPDVGSVTNVPADSSQDWWVIGYISGILGRSYYYGCQHMYKYQMKDSNAKVEVVATDPYGTEYRCSTVIEDGLNYPDYMKTVGWGYWN